MRKLFSTILMASLGLSGYGIQAQTVYSLDECKQMALQNNIKIRKANLGISQAQEQEKEAFSKYFPTVSASGSYFRSSDYLVQEDIKLDGSQQQKIAGIITQLGLNPQALASLPSTFTLQAIDHGTFADVMAMEPIFAGGQIANGNKLAKLQTKVRELQLKQTQDDIVYTTEMYYNQLVTLYEKQNTINAVEKQMNQIHKDAQNAYDGGLTEKNDVLTVELKQNEISANRLKIENGIVICKMVLAQYIGIPGTDIAIDNTIPDLLPDPSMYYIDPSSAIDNRVEVKLLDKNVEANQLQTKMKIGAMMPTIAVGAAGIYQDLSNKGPVNAIGLATVSIPISSWWSGNRVVRRLKIDTQVAEQEREDSRQLLMIQMQSSYNDLTSAYKQIEISKKSMEKSTENLRLNQDYYNAGTGSMSDLMDAQTQFQMAHDQYIDAVAQYLNCRTAYFIATGR